MGSILLAPRKLVHVKKQIYIVAMIRLKFAIVMLLVSLSLMSCSSSHQIGKHGSSYAQSKVVSSDSSWLVAPLQNEDLRLSDQQYISFWSGGNKVSTKPYTVATEGKPNNLTNIKSSVLRKTKGYRVQLFAGREQDRALDIKAAAESRFGISVYLVYEAPQYKVRVGNFVNRLQASELLNSIKLDGYRDAWIVRSQVEIEH